MSKTLSESAAEILQASMSAAGKESAQSLPAEMDDLGGQTPTTLPTDIGAKAAADAKEAPKPGVMGAPAEPMKKLPGSDAKKIGDEDEALKKNPYDAGSVKAEETEFEDEGEVFEEEVEQIDEAKSFFTTDKRGHLNGEFDDLPNPKEKVGGEHGAPLDSIEHNKTKDVTGKHHLQDKDIHSINQTGKVHMGYHRNFDDKTDYEAKRHPESKKWYLTGGEKDIEDANPPKYNKSRHQGGYRPIKMKEEVEQIDDFDNDQFSEEEVNYMEETKKNLVDKYRGSMREDVDALFNGESLSEDFRVKATLIFETAVQSRVEKIVEDVLAENDQILAEAVEEIKSELSEQVDEYLNYVVEEWVQENQVAIETGLRAELAEDFITGLKSLFEEHYIEIPEEKVDVAEELAVKVVELEEAAAAAAAEKNSLIEQLNAVKKEKAINLACEGLTQVQAEKIRSLAESVEFTAEGDFNNKLAIIRENYFPSKVSVKSEVKAIQESAVEEPEVEPIRDAIMNRYVQALTKTAPKA